MPSVEEGLGAGAGAGDGVRRPRDCDAPIPARPTCSPTASKDLSCRFATRARFAEKLRLLYEDPARRERMGDGGAGAGPRAGRLGRDTACARRRSTGPRSRRGAGRTRRTASGELDANSLRRNHRVLSFERAFPGGAPSPCGTRTLPSSSFWTRRDTSRPPRSLAHRIAGRVYGRAARGHRELNRALASRAASFAPDLVLVGKGSYFTAETLQDRETADRRRAGELGDRRSVQSRGQLARSARLDTGVRPVRLHQESDDARRDRSRMRPRRVREVRLQAVAAFSPRRPRPTTSGASSNAM